MNTARAARIWDLPVRLGHWALAISIAIAWLTAEEEAWRVVHIIAGCTAGAVVLFRLVWGIVGSTPARFGAFLRGPGAAWAELRSHLAGHARARSSHTVVGGWAALGLLGLALGTALSGLAGYRFDDIEALSELHEALAEGLLVLIGVHLAGVAVMSLLERQNLPRSMITGRAPNAPEAGVRSHPLAALTLAAWCGLAVWWLTRWLGLPL
ncbi:cytochrome b/b6 domain-containing protein [Niveibacterium sp. 24ML]|uniref:cytochrome b/b6 domain-containing protein n=1 Tax=Niveibacterium sp. 24ML TaxID=2985512 RepID=UPI00226D8725|nr:cytochrome b/b6 domain-containing protein [Niveibacterium sp. 24ML]MCX9155993.1 cytochrome b/b6 domain-containing protein [Niveibacterium sp. 24ML]